MSRPVIAVAGNPNSGKTTLFNRLTGANAKVGNYPGVTVERREGVMHLPDGQQLVVLDIPGTYSLSARSAEEQIAITTVAGLNPFSEPDVVIVVVDSTQLARNLYLALQVLELRLKVVLALNMNDIVRKARMQIDAEGLSQALGGVPVVPISASRGEGIAELKAAVIGLLEAPEPVPADALPALDGAALSADVAAVEPLIPRGWGRGDITRRRALAAWALVSIDTDDELWDVPADLRRTVLERHELAGREDRDIDLTVVSARYRWIDEHLPRFVSKVPSSLRRVTDAVDKVLIHPLVGFLLFVLLMSVVFESLFTWSAPAIDFVNTAVAAVAEGARAVLPAGLLRDFLTEGVINGVGAVLAFLPQILLLFLFISLMEDSGYMARAAFLMDRIMKAIGLTGRAFVPMISGFACAIPAIMATRTMERKRDRMLTMMVIPIMTCSARLPVYTLVIGALYPAPSEPGGTVAGFFSLQALLMVAMYMFSTVLALVAAAVLGRTVFKGHSVPLLLELPPYRMPSPRSVLRMMWERSRLFVTEAGSVILVCTIALWVLLAFPRDVDSSRDWAAEAAALRAGRLPAGAAAPVGADGSIRDVVQEELARLAAAERAERLQKSYGGRLGRLIEPVIAPLGFDWKIGVGLIGAFAAREVFVSTMGVVYGMGADTDETSQPLRERLHQEHWPDGRRVYTPLVGLSLMVFFALAAQCMSTLAVVRRETRSWGWPIFLFSYMTALAWVASFATYQIGISLGYG
ncbi:MAG: ferrous iron transport protein B [Planctomycetota bacterium]